MSELRLLFVVMSVLVAPVLFAGCPSEDETDAAETDVAADTDADTDAAA